MEMSHAVGVHVARSVTQFNTLLRVFFLHLMSLGLKQPISKNHSPSEQLEDDYNQIFFHFMLIVCRPI